MDITLGGRPHRGTCVHGVEISVGVQPIDLRCGVDRLAGIVTEQIARVAA